MDDMKRIYEVTRNLLCQTENISNIINNVKNKRLSEVLYSMLNTCKTDLMVFLDFISEAEACETDFEVNTLLESLQIRNDEVN